MDKYGRRFAREYFWFALALIAILLGSAARAAAADEPRPATGETAVMGQPPAVSQPQAGRQPPAVAQAAPNGCQERCQVPV